MKKLTSNAGGSIYNDIPLTDQLSNPDLTPNRSLHFVGDNDMPLIDAQPYNAHTTNETIEEQFPVKDTSVKKKLWQYRGGAAIVASPGDVLGKIYGTSIVQGRVIWSSEPKLNADNQPVIDVAYGLCEGVVNAMLKVYGGNDKQLLYGANSLEGSALAGKYWKKHTLFDGSESQIASNIILREEGEDDTPYFRGLAYIVIRGLKLWKFNNTCPDLWFVMGRQLDNVGEGEEPPDVYDGRDYFGVATISGFAMAGLDENIFFLGQSVVYRIDLLTETQHLVASGMGTTRQLRQDGIMECNGKIYCAFGTGLWVWDGGGGTSWTQLSSHLNINCMTVDGSRENLYYFSATQGRIYNVDLNDVVTEVTLASASAGGICINDDTGDIYYGSISNGQCYRYDGASHVPIGDIGNGLKQMEFIDGEIYALNTTPGFPARVQRWTGGITWEVDNVHGTSGNFLNGIIKFQDKLHVCGESGSPSNRKYVFRRVSQDSWEKLDVSYSGSSIYCMLRYSFGGGNTYLYACSNTNPGFMRMGDTVVP